MACLFGALFPLVASGTLVVCKNNTRVLGRQNINQKRSRKTSEFCFIFVRTHDIIAWYHNKHTMISLFHIDRLHVTWSAISATTTLCCHCRACIRCHVQARASASARAQDAASERERGHEAMSERTRTHAKSKRVRGHCQEWAPRHTMSKCASTQCHHQCDVVHDTTQQPTPASQFNFSYDMRG